MSTFLDKKINNNESSTFDLTNQQKLDLELDEFKAWLGERKKLIEKITLFQSWWKWIYKNELKESINDCCVEIAEVNDLNSESIKKLTDSIVEQMSLHRSSAMRDLYKNCIKKLNNIQALLSNAREENISKKLESELSEKDRVVKEKDSFISAQSRTILELKKEHQDLKDCSDKTVSKQVKEEIQKLGKKHAYEIQELREENQELKGEKDRKIEELKKETQKLKEENQERDKKDQERDQREEEKNRENQELKSEIEKLKDKDQERDKQVKTLMKLCNTFSLAQMATQNVPSTEMSSVQLSQSLPSLEK